MSMAMAPQRRPDPNHQESQWLDEDCFLEPVSADPPPDPSTPVVRDARGRLWRVRRRPPWSTVLAVVFLLVVLALMITVWLGA